MDRTGNEDETTTEDETDDAGWTGRWRANRARMFPVLPSSKAALRPREAARRVQGDPRWPPDDSAVPERPRSAPRPGPGAGSSRSVTARGHREVAAGA